MCRKELIEARVAASEHVACYFGLYDKGPQVGECCIANRHWRRSTFQDERRQYRACGVENLNLQFAANYFLANF
jgi:hypothetical protein